jgi:hypothetical protein
MSQPPGSGSPRPQIFALSLCPVPLFSTSILILYHFFDDIIPVCGVFVNDPAAPTEPQFCVGGASFPHMDMNKYAGF